MGNCLKRVYDTCGGRHSKSEICKRNAYNGSQNGEESHVPTSSYMKLQKYFRWTAILMNFWNGIYMEEDILSLKFVNGMRRMEVKMAKNRMFLLHHTWNCRSILNGMQLMNFWNGIYGSASKFQWAKAPSHRKDCAHIASIL